MSIRTQHGQLCKSAWLDLKQIGLTRKYVDEATTQRERGQYMALLHQKWPPLWCFQEPT